MNTYIIYGLVDPNTNQLRYIGKSQSGLRRPRQHFVPRLLSRDRTHKANWIRQVLTTGRCPTIVVIQTLPDTEILSQAEVFWISYFRNLGCQLTNACRGGNGFTGTHTPESRKKIGDAQRGKPRSEAFKRAVSAGATRLKSKPFVDQNGARYESIRSASRLLGIVPSCIFNVLKGIKDSTHGYKFTYLIAA